MLRILAGRIHQGHRTLDYPRTVPAMPDRFRGLPVLDASRCREDGCQPCLDACPTEALTMLGTQLQLDLGRCLFCGACEAACQTGAIHYTTDHRMATRRREDLHMHGEPLALAGALDARMKKLLGRSLKLRQVSAGGCNGCEAEINVLTTIVFDLARFGIDLVASPRHADGLLITGPVTRNMELALRKTWDAVPAPKIVIAVGACAISGGPFLGNPEHLGGAAAVVPVDLFIPGCPPHPLTILDGLLRLLGRLEPERMPA